MTIEQTSIQLTNEEALVLQQVYEDVETDIGVLAYQLGMKRTTLMSVLQELSHKHLVAIKKSYAELWINVSVRGKQLVHYMWPEQVMWTA